MNGYVEGRVVTPSTELRARSQDNVGRAVEAPHPHIREALAGLQKFAEAISASLNSLESAISPALTPAQPLKEDSAKTASGPRSQIEEMIADVQGLMGIIHAHVLELLNRVRC